MYNLNHNNYHQKPKPSNIQTPLAVSQFIFELLKDKVDKKKKILDPCSGLGSLLKPWKVASHPTTGIDIDKNSTADIKADFLKDKIFHFAQYKQKKRSEDSRPLILCNPPFNGLKPKLAPEIWLAKIIELFGKDIPLVLFAPIRLRLCSSQNNPRYQKWVNGTYPPISSIISLPTTGIFKGVDFFSEILIFNIKGLEPHYFFNPTSKIEQRTPI